MTHIEKAYNIYFMRQIFDPRHSPSSPPPLQRYNSTTSIQRCMAVYIPNSSVRILLGVPPRLAIPFCCAPFPVPRILWLRVCRVSLGLFAELASRYAQYHRCLNYPSVDQTKTPRWCGDRVWQSPEFYSNQLGQYTFLPPNSKNNFLKAF